MSTPHPWTLLIVAHGTVESDDDLPAFLSEIRRGRPAPPELLVELRERYRAVGGSPLLEQTQAQARALGRKLGLEARVAMRLWTPRVETVLADLTARDRVCLVPMAPFSVAVYEQAARTSLAKLVDPPVLQSIAPFGARPELVSAWVSVTQEALPSALAQTEVLLTAHSLPQFVIDSGDAYAREFEQAAGAVAQRLPVRSEFAYQSQGAVAGAWLGPSLADKMREAASRGIKQLVVSPIGFLTEHIETLYDLDIEAAGLARELGLRLIRAPALQESPGLIAALAAAVREVID